MNRRTRIAPALALTLAFPLLLLGVAAVAAQPAAPPAPAPEESIPRWDVGGFFGWRTARVDDTYNGSDRWDSRFVYGATAGYYLTPNIKAEVDVSLTPRSRYDEFLPRQVPGAPYPLYFRVDHRVVTTSVAGMLIYQFFENESFHPFLGAGAGVISIRDRITTARQSQVFTRTPGGPVEVVEISGAGTGQPLRSARARPGGRRLQGVSRRTRVLPQRHAVVARHRAGTRRVVAARHGRRFLVFTTSSAKGAVMSRLSRSIAAILIITFTSTMTTAHLAAQEAVQDSIGGATADDAAAANQAATVDLLRAYVTKLPVGSIVKVKLKEGKTVKGTLMVIEPDAVVVKPKTRIARPERRVPLTEIEFVELQERNGANIAKSVAIGVATGAGAFLGLMLVAFTVIDD